MSDLRGKLLMILAQYGRAYDTFAAADRILALLPKVPELRWDEDGRLFCGQFFVGSTDNYGEGCHQGYIVNPDAIEWCEMVAKDEPTDQAARDAVEAAVRKALGWEA